MAYIGVSPSNGVRRVHTYTATASQTTFSGAGAEGTSLSYKDSNFVAVYQNGVKLGDADYTATSGTSIVLGTGASASDLVVIVVFDVFSVADTVSKADGGTFDGNVTMAGTLGVTGAVTANAGVNIDNITIDGTEIDLSSGDLTIDVAGDISIDAGGGDTRFKHNDTEFLAVQSDSSLCIFKAVVQDKDIQFRGNDGGSTITALTLDMSEAGQATFNSSIVVSESVSITSSNTSAFAQAGDNIFQLGTSTSDDFAFFTNNTERFRLDSAGRFLIGKTSDNSTLAGVNFETGGSGFVTLTTHCAFFNRQNNDGNLILLVQQNITEGTISVSGSTVSYNGGHLSRFSQLADNTRDNTIVKGTVMTNLDQMAEWTTDGVTEQNEQLNCMAVSSVEGDVNVAGVFVNWDNDDKIYTNDMNVAMTGDMVIRIAKGTTVARGDLLMSAGDGTAKPQGDDIVKSKTIAKVTSTNVSHTYDDGTYLVPCVLMAC